MDFVEIRYEMPIEEYGEEKINDILRFYSGKLKDTIFTDSNVILIISAPSTWWIIMVQSLLAPYRYM